MKRNSFVLALIMIQVSMSFAQDQKSDPEAIAIVKQAIAAHGGSELCSKSLNAKIEIAGVLCINNSQVKFHTVIIRHQTCRCIDEYIFENKNRYSRTIVTEKDAWYFDKSGDFIDWLDTDRQDTIEFMRLSALSALAFDPESKDITITKQNNETIEGVECSAVCITICNVPGRIVLYFDNKTLLLNRCAIYISDNRYEYTQCEYIKFCGMQVQTKMTYLKNGTKMYDAKLKSFEFIESKPDPKIFTKPVPKKIIIPTESP